MLILGSFPSEASLAARHYYAHSQSQFWRVLAAILDLPLMEFDYPANAGWSFERKLDAWRSALRN